jgi:hypothetical protein
MDLEFWSQKVASYSRVCLFPVMIVLISMINGYFLQEQVWRIPIQIPSFVLCTVWSCHFLLNLNIKFELSQVYQSCFDLHIFVLTHR